MKVSKKYLENQAKNLGRNERWVRYLVDSKLIPKGSAKGQGRGKGQSWGYDPETLQQLIWVHKIRALFGYRGDALRFVVWWKWGGSPTHEVRRYMANIYLKLRNRIDKAIQREAARISVLDTKEPTAEVSIDRAVTLGDMIDKRGMKPIEGLSPEDLFSPFIVKQVIYSEDTQQTLDVLLSTIAGIRPSDIGVSALYLDKQIRSVFNSFPISADVFSGVLHLIHDNAWVDKLNSWIFNCPENVLNEMRNTARANDQIRRILNAVVRWEYINQSRTSTWKVKRLGPWQKPAAAYRACLLLFMFFWRAISGGLDFSEISF